MSHMVVRRLQNLMRYVDRTTESSWSVYS